MTSTPSPDVGNTVREDEDRIMVPQIAAVAAAAAAGKGKYELVSLSGRDDDDEEDPPSDPQPLPCHDDDDDDDDVIPTDGRSRCQKLFHRTLLPDSCFAFRDIRILDGVEAVRFWKFFGVTLCIVLFVHHYVQWAHLERDADYTLSDLVLYDGNWMVLDMILFYVVGRLYHQRGVDHLAWCGMALLGGLYPSWAMSFSFLQYSVSLYSIACVWPYSLWFYVIAVVLAVSVMVYKHVQYAIRTQGLVIKVVEVTMTVLLFLVPQITNPNFHFHHWYAGLLLGMHCNYNTWWSRACMAYCWGLYMNGIAVYGRDSPLTCAYGYFVSIDSACPFLQCFLTAQAAASNVTDHTSSNDYQPLPTPDWRNCSASDNYTP